MSREIELAEKMFNAYNEESPNPWKTFDGRDVPRWPALGEQVQAKWRAAARVAMSALGFGREAPTAGTLPE